MRSSVIVFPGSNCDRDIAMALEKMQFKNQMIWHKDTSLPKSDLIVILVDFLWRLFEVWGNSREIFNYRRGNKSCKRWVLDFWNL